MSEPTHAADREKPAIEKSPSVRSEPQRNGEASWIDRPVAQTRKWIHDHPTAAVLLAAGAGVLLGRLIAGSFSSPPPPPLSRGDRLRARARVAADSARAMMDEAGGHLVERASRARSTAESAWSEVGNRLSQAPQAGADLLDRVGQAVQHGVVRGVTKKVADWVDELHLRK